MWCCEDNKRYFGLENSRFNFTVSLVLHFHLDSSDDSDNYLENLTACELQNKSNCQSKKWNLITPKPTRTIAWRVTQSVFCPCGTDWSGWLKGAHPTVEDCEVQRTVCFSDRSTGCRDSKSILVKNCRSYFIYKLFPPSSFFSRHCGTDWMWSKYTWRGKRTQKSLRRYMCIRCLCDLVNLSSLS